jgi:alcohol dehydrogenase class IV
MSITSGMNAIAHAVEALYAENANPVLSKIAQDGIAAMVRALPIISQNATDPEARYDALYGAWLCAVSLGTGGVALHHKLCHVLGGSFDLPHAQTHTIILPHALSYNAQAVPEAMAVLRQATNSDDPAAHFYDIAKAGGVPMALKDLGMPEASIAQAVETTMENPYYNPRALERRAIHDIISAAWHGTRP